jgi:predicted GIY-YIG superfamily endonuclease
MRVASVYLLRCADTRSRRPVELAVVISVPDRSAALREEARIKRLPRAAKLHLIEASLEGA